jgi:hypothetical protein
MPKTEQIKQKTEVTAKQDPTSRQKMLKRVKIVRPRRSAPQKKHRPVKRASSGARILVVPVRIWYKPQTWQYRQPVPDYKPLPKARVIFWNSLKQLWANRKMFGGIVLIYGLLNLVLVRGVAGSNSLQTLKNALESLLHGFTGTLITSGVSFGYLLISSGSNSTATSGVYQAVLLIVCSLAFIWALRKVTAKQKSRIRDSFYLGMYPLIPFVLIIVLISLQLIPMVAGVGVYALATAGGIVTDWWQRGIFLVIFVLLAFWSLRMLTASVFALYIVSLPDMTPLRAYRSARELVYGRRLLLWRKLIFLPFILLLLAGLIELPLILYLTTTAVWAFFIISMATLPIVHSYLYNLYREML